MLRLSDFSLNAFPYPKAFRFRNGYLTFAFDLMNPVPSEPKKKIVHEALHDANLSTLATSRHGPQLSGGEAQRMALLGLTPRHRVLAARRTWKSSGSQCRTSVVSRSRHRVATHHYRTDHPQYQCFISTPPNGLMVHCNGRWNECRTIKWTIPMNDELLPRHLGELYGLRGQYVDVGNTKQIIYMAEDS